VPSSSAASAANVAAGTHVRALLAVLQVARAAELVEPGAREHDREEEVGQLVVGGRLAAQAHDREHREQPEADADAHVARGEDRDRQEEADVEHRVHDAQVAAAVAPPEQAERFVKAR
jgi:hypothetical protein